MKDKKEKEEKELFFTKERYMSVKEKIQEYNKKMGAGNKLTTFFK